MDNFISIALSDFAYKLNLTFISILEFDLPILLSKSVYFKSFLF